MLLRPFLNDAGSCASSTRGSVEIEVEIRLRVLARREIR